jgi:hypothetical protein
MPLKSDRWTRLAWFVAIWITSVAGLALVAWIVRSLLPR